MLYLLGGSLCLCLCGCAVRLSRVSGIGSDGSSGELHPARGGRHINSLRSARVYAIVMETVHISTAIRLECRHGSPTVRSSSPGTALGWSKTLRKHVVPALIVVLACLPAPSVAAPTVTTKTGEYTATFVMHACVLFTGVMRRACRECAKLARTVRSDNV